MDAATTATQALATAAATQIAPRSLDQQEEPVVGSPNHSHYSNLTNSSNSSSNASSPSVASDTSHSSSSSSSAPQYSEDLRRQQRQRVSHSGSGSGSAKNCELDVGEEERDTFSPVSSPECNGAAAAALVTAGTSRERERERDNKSYECKLKPPSKEEKQRQNEEIVCMETSTVSTETGSWESVYPNALPAPSQAPLEGITASCLLREFEKRGAEQLSTSGHSACFIDASSLRDEDEVLSFPSLDGQQANEPEPPDDEADADADDDEADVKPESEMELEQFHKAFAKCKAPPRSSQSNCSSDVDDEPQPDSNSATHNLSDEEKLWKRDQQLPASGGVTDATEASSVSLPADADSSDSSLSARRRRVAPTVQATAPMAVPYHFQHNAQQFSVHPLASSPKFASHHAPDLSYTTDYSSSSPGHSIVWSSEQQPQSQPRQQQHTAAPLPSLATETPHNSMVHVLDGHQVGSNNSSIHRDYTLSSSLSHHRDSGAYCSDATDSPLPLPRTPKRCSKFDEANPIVSGGASIEDFRQKHCDSPSLKRRTADCPIVSGGFVSLDFAATRPQDDDEDDDEEAQEDAELAGVELRVKSSAQQQRKPLPGIASWVVDMSDCRPERRKSSSSTSSLEAATSTPSRFRERSDSNSSHKSGCGFYVSLDDMDRKPKPSSQTQPQQPQQSLSKSYTAPKAANFFVNLSQSDYQAKEQQQQQPPPEAKPEQANGQENDKKNNIFSMFIDFGEPPKARAQNGRKEPFNLAQRLSSSLSVAQRRGDDVMKSSASSTETLMAKSGSQLQQQQQLQQLPLKEESKSLDYRCNLEQQPLTVAALRRMQEPSKRHSWGSNNSSKDSAPTNDCKRSISFSTNGGDQSGAGLMSIIDKLPIISKASSLSVDSSLSPYDDYSGASNAGALSSCSDEEQQQAARMKKRRRDAQLNETYDKSSSVASALTEGVLSKDMSPASNTDTDDLTFQQDEQLALREVQQQQQLATTTLPLQLSSSSNRTSIMETIIEAKETASPKKQPNTTAATNGHTMETLHATIEKQKQLLETVNEHAEQPSSFVKLSDMDKPAAKHELQSPDAMSKSAGNNQRSNSQRFYRDQQEQHRGGVARPHSWAMTRSTGGGNNGGNNIQQFASSVDNLRSLSRLFPNFSKEFSNSLPGDMTLDNDKQQQQQQLDYIQTDLSADSSLASSFSRSGMDESSLSCRQPRRLGEDLLKMFLQEIATDMLVEVHGRRIRAHKCILRSRCQYFAAMLAGHGSQSVVSLQGYSYAAVHFALCHIYSGASHPPDGISLMELAALADLLGLEGLKEVTSHALKTNYCHNFHKPCSGCIDGILQVLPVALNHALDDLYRKCLRWTCRHYLKVWPTRQFAQLPPDILGRCRQQIVAYLTSESVLDTVLDCDHLLAQLSAYRWGHVCEQLVRDILDAAYAYVGDHFASLIASDSFLSLGHDRSRHIPRLESLLLQTAAALTPEQACRSYQRVTRLNTVLQAKLIQMPVNLGELAKELQGLQEEQLDWQPEYIRLVSALVYAVEQCLIRQCSRAMRVTAWQRMDLELRKKIQTMARLTEPLDMKRNGGKPVSKAFSFGGSTRSQDLVQIKLAIQAQSKRAQAQETHVYKATQTNYDVHTTERGVQAQSQTNHDLREGNSKLLKSNSRAYVPQSQSQRSSSQTATERHSLNTHRRTQSEAPPATTQRTAQKAVQQPTAVSEAKVVAAANRSSAPVVRARYLEPRKPRAVSNTNGNSNHTSGPVRSSSSTIPATARSKAQAKNLHISSSDSSRNSSPAALRRGQQNGNTRLGNKSSNMSSDSLAKSGSRERYSSDLNVDSLAESMKSSVITNKTISHESLSSSSKLARVQQLNGHGNKSATTAALPPLRGTQRGSTVGNKSTRQLKQQHNAATTGASNGSSPSSVHTTKSATSRLSSVSSTLSTRELFKQRSISVPAGGEVPAKGRHSFLSAKSREILAKRAEKNKLQQQQQQQQQQQNQQQHSSGDERSSQQLRASAGPLRSSSHSAVSSMLQQHNLRNSLPSNIPTRRPNTLQLRKTTTTTTNGNVKHSTNGGGIGIMNGHQYTKAAQAVKQKLDLLIDHAQLESSGNGDQRVESKLERSSTFCKDSADLDLDVSELQIVE
ncbi:uncharacterized protein LOC132788750 [Drosophila nasuta]|uniref:uncharacterized protein LOC132788750 n=1 Tax=Drosophila nasuta TaxID=42062 RepID=UPI00295F4F34|nr:uncharacterized protein LOC132788750 [Drosophila nasuta]XP_060652291.1 uncharacterized protein LOC132788750 [Drosophila nasuta]